MNWKINAPTKKRVKWYINLASFPAIWYKEVIYIDETTSLGYVWDWTTYQSTSGMTIAFTTVTDPALNIATSTANIDSYAWVIITLTWAWNNQTLQDPTDITIWRTYIVVNNDTSSDSINVIDWTKIITLEPWEAHKYIWDWTSWIAITAIDAWDINFIPYWGISSINVQDAIQELDDEKVRYDEWLQNWIVDRSDSTLNFNDGTRVFTINRSTPWSGDFSYYIQWIKYTVATDDVLNVNYVTLTDTEWFWIVYYDWAVLTAINSPTHEQFEDIIVSKCLVWAVYYDATNNVWILYDERHWLSMSPYTHRYIHETIWFSYSTGLWLWDFIISDWTDNEDAQFSISSWECYDEDFSHNLNAINSTTWNIIYYKVWSDWRWTTQTWFKCITFDWTSATRLAWDNAWTLTEVADNKFVLVHIFASNTYDWNCITVIWQNEYFTANLARVGAESEISILVLWDLPTKEMKPIATIIYQTKNTYANDVNAKIVQTDSLENYIDWRTTSLSAWVSASDHGALWWLANDDHIQYGLLIGRSGWQTLIGSTDASENLLLQSTSNATKGIVWIIDWSPFIVWWTTVSGSVNGVSITSQVASAVDNDTTRIEFVANHYNNTSSTGSIFYGARSRGTAASPTIVQDWDNLLDIIAVWNDWTDWAISSMIAMEVDWTPWNDDMPWRIVFLTSPDWSQTPVEAMRISKDKSVTFAWAIKLDWTPDTDATANWAQTNTFTSGYSSAVWDLVFMWSGGKWLEVDADALATCNWLIWIALEAKTDTQAMNVALPWSFIRLDSWNWTVWATLYAWETLWSMQEAIPTWADAIKKVVGFAMTADIVYFKPSSDQQSVVA